MSRAAFRRSRHSCTFHDLDPAHGIVGPRTREKVCILGASSTDEPLPFDDETYELWGCNALWRRACDPYGYFRADRWFELHPFKAQSTRDLEQIRACPIPLYTLPEGVDLETWDAPMAVVYPFQRAAKMGRAYFTNTFAFQVALAIAEGFTTIALANIWLEGGRELCVERACLEFWLGVAIGRGVHVEIPTTGKMLSHPYVYGYDYYAEKAWVEDMLRERVDSITKDAFEGSK